MAGRVARFLTASLGTAPLLLLGLAADALTRDDEALGFERTPPRLSYADGEVTFLRAGSEGWTAAQVNTPLAPGDLLLAGDAANLELQIGPRAFVRGAEQTEIGLTTLEPDFLQLRVTSGTVAFDLRSLAPGQTLEIDTPNAAFKIEQAGYYRLEVGEELSAFTSRRGGLASATIATGDTVGIGANEQLAIQGALTPQLQTAAAPELDAWDRWNYARSEPPREAVSARYVPSDVYGVDELDRYGDWRVEQTYGPVWYPRGVAASWAPYSTGDWLYDPYYGWSWVDTAPWGWAPFHYGRWVYTSGLWGWCPGPRVARAWYAPALVAFYGSPSVVAYPSTGWVALGYGEPLYPWWGPTYFRAKPHWAGWGGYRRSWQHDDHDGDHHHGGDHGGHGGWDHSDSKGDGHGRDWQRGDGKDRDGHGWDRDGKDRGGERDHGDRAGELHPYENARVKGAIVRGDRGHTDRRSSDARASRRPSHGRREPTGSPAAPRDERVRRELPDVAASAPRDADARSRRSERNAAHAREPVRERSRPQPPQQDARGDRDANRGADRRTQHAVPRAERAHEPRRERAQAPRVERVQSPRVERAPEPRAERPREPRAQRAPEPRVDRSSERQTARSDRPEMSSRRHESARGDRDAGRSRGNDGGGRSDRSDRGDGGGRR